MKKFKITVQREIEDSFTLEVEANDLSQAKTMAIEFARGIKHVGRQSQTWCTAKKAKLCEE